MKKFLMPVLIGSILSGSMLIMKTKTATKTDGYSKKQEKVVKTKQVVIKDKKITNRTTVSNSENKKIRDDIKKGMILQQKQLAKENKEKLLKAKNIAKANSIKAIRPRKVR